MIVADLIKRLQELPQDLPVVGVEVDGWECERTNYPILAEEVNPVENVEVFIPGKSWNDGQLVRVSQALLLYKPL